LQKRQHKLSKLEKFNFNNSDLGIKNMGRSKFIKPLICQGHPSIYYSRNKSTVEAFIKFFELQVKGLSKIIL